jgi:hypothetical protein
MDMVKFQKLDARFRSYPNFRWAIDFGGFNPWAIQNPNSNCHKYAEIRRWCWEQFGASTELAIWQATDYQVRNPNWCWDFFETKMRIYLSEETYNWAILKWQK